MCVVSGVFDCRSPDCWLGDSGVSSVELPVPAMLSCVGSRGSGVGWPDFFGVVDLTEGSPLTEYDLYMQSRDALSKRGGGGGLSVIAGRTF